MTELQIVSTKEILGRSFTVYGTIEEPLFLAKDVAEMIDYAKTSKGSYDVSNMLKTIDEDEKLVRKFFVSGQKRDVWMLTENGLYEVLFQSNKPIAKEFKGKVKELLHNLRTNKVTVIPTKTDREMNIEEAHILENLIPMCPVDTYKQILAAHISKKVTGEFLLPLPKVEKEVFTATQIAEKYGITKQKVGLIANQNNLKTKEYGEIIWDCAKNGKQVENFVYYKNGVERFKEFLK